MEGNESDNVYVSAVMVKIMSVAQREEKAAAGRVGRRENGGGQRQWPVAGGSDGSAPPCPRRYSCATPWQSGGGRPSVSSRF